MPLQNEEALLAIGYLSFWPIGSSISNGSRLLFMSCCIVEVASKIKASKRRYL